ncbi:hypothetical protein DFJ74DRAFT_693241 [Hyaloraphidium curvatum]|nr:hypothetical protein DFJ74DRAFT_693241 [Hyaloraphidium curvatum]
MLAALRRAILPALRSTALRTPAPAAPAMARRGLALLPRPAAPRRPALLPDSLPRLAFPVGQRRSIYQLPRRRRKTQIQKVAFKAKRRRLKANKPNQTPLKVYYG